MLRLSGNIEAHESVPSFKTVQSLQTAALRTIELAQAGMHHSQEAVELARIVVSCTPLSALFDGVVT